nr:hypothetical protein [Tanacetum cinerariifolium]
EEDEELFEINYIEFIRRDMEGSDLDTRRMIACKLLKGIMGNYKDKISAKAGGAFVSTDLVDVDSFFRTFIVPELRGQDVNAFPMLKVDVNVVHSYAASCIEKLLLVKDNGVQARYTTLDVGPILLALMTNLFGALEKPESEENQYIMRCIIRVLQIADISHELSPQLVDLNRSPVLEYYMQIFDILLTTDLWKKSANIPALVQYMNYIWFTLFTRVQNNATPRLVRCLIIFMSLFMVKHGTQTLVDSVNSAGVNLFNSILDMFWIPTLKTITGNTVVELSAVASAKLLCKSPSLLDLAAEELWGKLLDGIVTLLSQPEEQRVGSCATKGVESSSVIQQ